MVADDGSQSPTVTTWPWPGEDERVSALVERRSGDVEDAPPAAAAGDVAVDGPDSDVLVREGGEPRSGEQAVAEPAGPGEQADVEQDAPAPTPAQLRVDFGAHLEANYQRLVAQLYAITLDPGEAHDVVQDAYSRAWRNWSTVSRSPDPTAWVRRVAVRSTIRSWRRVLARLGIGRSPSIGSGVDPRTGALLAALGRLPSAERRSVVLYHMAGASYDEIAAVEQTSRGTVQARLARAQHVVSEGMADVLPEVLGLAPESYDDDQLDSDPYPGTEYGSDAYSPGPLSGTEYGEDRYDGSPYGGDRYDNEGERR
jgi:DNA-directed RNA polymerase specialized sigma24 family protein